MEKCRLSAQNQQGYKWLTGSVKMIMEGSGVGALSSFLKGTSKETTGGRNYRKNNNILESILTFSMVNINHVTYFFLSDVSD